ncbi:class I SAM-dependent methyltransferase [Halorussus salinus]|uniref:class I SAM-dependent methyltransferase n=1 Tax=Halorussus salinus TaxID=1364935 RepID=UPI0010930A00|nr:class I SAM-dependent methyltransferase [Halorussus salinus]
MNGTGDFYDPIAPAYDPPTIVTGEEEIAEDVRFYRALAREIDGPTLEVGVGTGRIYLELLADGIDIDGIDVSSAMIDQLREYAASCDLDPSVWVDDLLTFAPEREYDLVYAPEEILNFFPSMADQRTALERVHDALAPDGRFATNMGVPQFETIAENDGRTLEQHIEADSGHYRIERTAHLEDEIEQLARIEREVYCDGELVGERETMMSLISKRQCELLFELAGFSDWQVYGGFERDPLSSSDQEMVWVVEA